MNQYPTIFPWLSKRTPPHQQGRDDDWLNRNHMRLQRSVVGDSGDEEEYGRAAFNVSKNS